MPLSIGFAFARSVYRGASVYIGAMKRPSEEPDILLPEMPFICMVEVFRLFLRLFVVVF